MGHDDTSPDAETSRFPYCVYDEGFRPDELSEEELASLHRINMEFRAYFQQKDRVLSTATELRLLHVQSRMAEIETEIARRRHDQSKRDKAWQRSLSKDTPKAAHPPRLVFGWLLKRFLSPQAYGRFIEPHVADMHEEYFAALERKADIAARWAVIRAHLHVVPSWVWALVAQLIARVTRTRA